MGQCGTQAGAGVCTGRPDQQKPAPRQSIELDILHIYCAGVWLNVSGDCMQGVCDDAP